MNGEVKLKLSEAAYRALYQLPPRNKAQCEKHGEQTMARYPDELRKAALPDVKLPEWDCQDCVKAVLEEANQTASAIRRQLHAEKVAEKMRVKQAKKDLESHISGMDQKLEELLQACESKGSTRGSLLDNLDEKRSAIEQTANEMRIVRKEIDSLQKHIQRLEQDYASLQERLRGGQIEMHAAEGCITTHDLLSECTLDELSAQLKASLEAWSEASKGYRRRNFPRELYNRVRQVLDTASVALDASSEAVPEEVSRAAESPTG